MTRMPGRRRRLRLLSLCGALGLLAGATPMWGQAQTATYTALQAEAGEVAYQDVCASCHKADLAGTAFEAPELAGSSFLSMWNGRPARELFAYIKAAMPPAGRKPDDETLTNIVAYILRQNGMRAGFSPFAATADGAIVTPAQPARD
jgi:mono/diheme cytochrome c family protein